ncbi:hypothetical protein ACFE04_005839 [Oxalis oulophora]
METELKDLHSKSATDAIPLLKPKATATETVEELEKKYAAYVRNDVYGQMGRGELPLEEKILVCTLFLPSNQDDYAHIGGWRRVVIVVSGRFLARLMLFVFGFYYIHEKSILSTRDDDGQKHDTPGAIISNHVSYVDILYHMSTSFASFVAKRSVAKLPLVGIISKCLGCVYVQRESKSSDFKGVAGVVTQRIEEAHKDPSAPKMMLFPEGTTTNGDYLLPFKTGAFLARTPVLPVILRYPYRRFSPSWDSISGARHLILLLCQFVNYMEVTRLPVYCPSQEEKDDPKLYADNVRRLMATEGNLVMSDIGLAEKRVYHNALNGNNSLTADLSLWKDTNGCDVVYSLGFDICIFIVCRLPFTENTIYRKYLRTLIGPDLRGFVVTSAAVSWVISVKSPNTLLVDVSEFGQGRGLTIIG